MTLDRQATFSAGLAQALNAINELAAVADVEQLLERAVDFALRDVGLGAAVLFLREYNIESGSLCASWGATMDGTVRDAGFCHACRTSEHRELLEPFKREVGMSLVESFRLGLIARIRTRH